MSPDNESNQTSENSTRTTTTAIDRKISSEGGAVSADVNTNESLNFTESTFGDGSNVLDNANIVISNESPELLGGIAHLIGQIAASNNASAAFQTQTMAEVFGGYADRISDFAAGTLGFFTNESGEITERNAALLDATENLAGESFNASVNLADAGVDLAAESFNLTNDLAENAFNVAENLAQGAYDNAHDLGADTIDAATGLADGAYDTVRDLGAGLFDSAENLASGAFNAARDLVATSTFQDTTDEKRNSQLLIAFAVLVSIGGAIFISKKS